MSFSFVDIEQGTAAWHSWRLDGIGGSDAAVIMGETQFKTVEELLLEKCGLLPVRRQTYAMRQGLTNEKEAREHYMKRFKRIICIPSCIMHNNYEWLRASVDGIDFINEIVVEIKCGPQNYRNMEYERAIPPWHYPQFQHTLAVTGYKSLDFWSWLPGERGIKRTIKRNEKYIEKLVDKEQKFWFRVLSERDRLAKA